MVPLNILISLIPTVGRHWTPLDVSFWCFIRSFNSLKIISRNPYHLFVQGWADNSVLVIEIFGLSKKIFVNSCVVIFPPHSCVADWHFFAKVPWTGNWYTVSCIGSLVDFARPRKNHPYDQNGHFRSASGPLPVKLTVKKSFPEILI